MPGDRTTQRAWIQVCTGENIRTRVERFASAHSYTLTAAVITLLTRALNEWEDRLRAETETPIQDIIHRTRKVISERESQHGIST